MPMTSDLADMAGTIVESLKPHQNEHVNAGPKSAVEIIDIRRAAVELDLKEQIVSLFQPEKGPRRLPTLLLYNERGLQIFEDITYLDEYYLTNDEIAILKSSAAEIVKDLPNGSMLIELGSGNLRKVKYLLQALEDAQKDIEYFALDLSREELERTLAQLPAYKHVRCRGLLGTYDDGRDWLKGPEKTSRNKCILSLGSSIGNFDRDEGAAFLREFSEVLRPGDKMLIGLDSCSDPAKVYHAYNDKKGITHEFILNGLRHANHVMGQHIFQVQDWNVIGEYVHDAQGGRHQAFYSPKRDTLVLGELIRPHERIQVEQSLKYSEEEAFTLWSEAGMKETFQWKHGTEYGLHMLEKPKMPFSLLPSLYAKTVLPTLADWEALWHAWDTVTLKMLPQVELQEKPIKLRNACIFYLGHIPTFLDIQLNKTTGDPATEPKSYSTIFERGIDPDVDNPENCHAHSEIPDEWPPLEEILSYQVKVRARLSKLYNDGNQDKIARKIGRAIWLGFEHEVMHLETLLYMMLQSDKTLPPPGAPRPDFEKLAAKAEAARVPNKWFDIPAQDVQIGMNDPENGSDSSVHFGWDNEKPARQAHVHAFQAQGRPITNEEYAKYLYSSNDTRLPASWAQVPSRNSVEGTNGSTVNGTNGSTVNGTNGSTVNGTANGSHANEDRLPSSFLQDKAVRTVYGLVPLKHALDWPVQASYDELAQCAAYMGGRIPTYEEAQSIYTYAEISKKKEGDAQLGKTIPAVNSHLCNNGVDETPPADPKKKVGDGVASQSHLFLDLDGANVGFQHWHPVAVTGRGDQLAGHAEMGGVWEWTSTVLQPWEGFEPMSIYPGYTADFFDEKHNIVLGGSWATHPRVAGRKSFVNWYQRNYIYPWVGARLVRDI